MNRLGETYIADKIAAYRIRLCGAWSLSCVERALQDRDEANTPS